VQGNVIGLNQNGGAAGGLIGVSVSQGADGTVIGGTSDAARNVLSGNAAGIQTDGAEHEDPRQLHRPRAERRSTWQATRRPA